MLGRTSRGMFVSKLSQAYPAELCLTLAKVVVGSLVARQVGRSYDSEEVEGALEEAELGDKLPVPPIAMHWDDQEWSVDLVKTWEKEEHINVLEVRTVILCLSMIARSTQNWGRRVLIAVDSQVTLSSLAKGRSSRPGINWLARRAAALQLGLGLKMVLRWVPTKRNQADGPSRGQGIGPAKSGTSSYLQLPDGFEFAPG